MSKKRAYSNKRKRGTQRWDCMTSIILQLPNHLSVDQHSVWLRTASGACSVCCQPAAPRSQSSNHKPVPLFFCPQATCLLPAKGGGRALVQLQQHLSLRWRHLEQFCKVYTALFCRTETEPLTSEDIYLQTIQSSFQRWKGCWGTIDCFGNYFHQRMLVLLQSELTARQGWSQEHFSNNRTMILLLVSLTPQITQLDSLEKKSFWYPYFILVCMKAFTSSEL